MESCFPECCKIHFMVLVCRNGLERFTAKNYCPVSVLSVVSKIFEKLENDWLVRVFHWCLVSRRDKGFSKF